MREVPLPLALLFLGDYLMFFLMMTGFYVALIAHRLGLWMLVVGSAGHLTAHRTLGIFGALELDPSELRLKRKEHRLLASAYGVLLLLVMAGIFVAVAGARIGGLMLIVGFVLQFAIDLTVGLRSYRSVMRRPWPQVAALVDDDDW